VIWQCDLRERFGGSVPTWGLCATPLVLDGTVIVPTCSPVASLVGLDAATGTTVWVAPGRAPGYGSAIAALLGGVRQVVWHDKDTLGGWSPQTGRRLWTLKPPESNDFNVPTPVVVGDRLLVATENNGTRLYAFQGAGRIVPKPVAQQCETRPNTASPVVVDGVAWAPSEFGLVALDTRAGLRAIWKPEDPAFLQHASVIGAPGRVLVVTLEGRVCLAPARPPTGFSPALRTLPVDASYADDVAVWSHPAVVGNRLYVRTNREILCLRLD
jgi:outer membrane protein assembly factor BamB